MFGWIRRLIAYLRRRIDWIRMPESERRVVVAHEAGHAFAAWHLEAIAQVAEVCVLPMGPYRGYTMTANRHELLSVDEAYQLMIMSMAGMAAERLLIGDVSEGGQQDMMHVIALWLMISYGMSDVAASHAAYDVASDLFGDDDWRRAVAEDLVGPAIAAFYAAAIALLQPRIDGLRALAKMLRRRKILRHRDLERLLGPRKYVAVEAILDAAYDDPP